MEWDRGRRRKRRRVFAQANAVALFVVTNSRQVGPHQQQATVGRAFQVLRGERVGDQLRIESRPLILDLGHDAIRAHMVADGDRFAPVSVVAMFMGIDDRFFQGQMHSKLLLFRIPIIRHLRWNNFQQALQVREGLNRLSPPQRDANLVRHKLQPAHL